MDFSPVYSTLNENQLLRAQQNEEDTNIYRLLSRYTYFWQKYDVSIQNGLTNKCTPVDFSPFYGTLNENQLLRAKQNQEKGDTDTPFTVTVYLFPSKMSLFNLTEFGDVRVF